MIQTFTPQVIPALSSQTGSTYMVAITIRVGFGNISLKSDSLKSEEISQALKANGVHSKDTLPIYEAEQNGKKFSLKQAGNVLGTMLDRLQAQYMLCSGSKRWWFVAEADWPSVSDGIQEMETERLVLLNQLQAIYHDAHCLFRTRLGNILTAADRLDELEVYERKFPTWQEIGREFRIEVDGPVQVPSIADLAKQSPDMQRWMENVHQQMQRDLPRLVDDICDAVANLFTKLEQVEPGHLSETQTNHIDKGRERLESLGRLHDSMSQDHHSPGRSLVTYALKVSGLLGFPHTTQQSLGKALSALRRDLKDDELLMGSGKGARALHQWVNGASAEDKLRDLVAQVKQLQQELPDLPDAELQARLQTLKAQAETHAGLLTHAAGNLAQMLSRLIDASPNVKIDGQSEARRSEAPVTDREVVEAGF